MALPSSGGIMMTQVASELGVSAAGLTLGAANVRALAGISSGAIYMSNLRGKSNVLWTANLTVGVFNNSSGYMEGTCGALSPNTLANGMRVTQIIQNVQNSNKILVYVHDWNNVDYMNANVKVLVLDGTIEIPLDTWYADGKFNVAAAHALAGNTYLSTKRNSVVKVSFK